MAITALIAPATKLLGKFIQDKDKKAELAHKLATMADEHAQQLALAQIKLNKDYLVNYVGVNLKKEVDLERVNNGN